MIPATISSSGVPRPKAIRDVVIPHLPFRTWETSGAEQPGNHDRQAERNAKDMSDNDEMEDKRARFDNRGGGYGMLSSL